ncbi:MAG: RodZ domain-containing protein [Candidatus Competibacteraceae bacterium]
MSNEIATDFTPETPGAPVESLGAWFTQVRTRHGLELREAARHLMLNPTIVQAMEADDFARLGPPVFVRGYLSRYARLLDMPDHEVLERFRQQISSSQEPPPLQVVHPLRRQTRARDLRGLVYLALLVGVGWTAIQHLPDLDPSRLTALWSGDRPSAGSPIVHNPNSATSQVHYPFQSKPAETTAPVPATSLASEAPPATSPSSEPTPSTVATLTPPSASVVFTAPPNPAPTPALSGVDPSMAAPSSAPFAIRTSDTQAVAAADGEAKLLLEFSNDCWVEIKDAEGNVLTSGLMRGNTTHTLSGPAPFKVTLGNAPAARIVLDDRLVDTTIYVPRRGTVSRFTLNRE